MDKIETNEIKYKDIKEGSMFYYNTECEWLSFSDPYEAFQDFVENNIDENYDISNQPKLYIFEKDPMRKITSDDIFDMYYDYTNLDSSYIEEPVNEMNEALIKVNEIISKMPQAYVCIGYICPEDVKNEWLDCFRDAYGED